MNARVVAIETAYYDRLRRRDSFEVGEAFAALRARFPFAPMPDEVDRHRSLLADAYQDSLNGEALKPIDDDQLETARELARVGAFWEWPGGSFYLAEDVVSFAKNFAEERYLRDHPICQPDDEPHVDRSALAILVGTTLLGLIALAGAMYAISQSYVVSPL